MFFVVFLWRRNARLVMAMILILSIFGSVLLGVELRVVASFGGFVVFLALEVRLVLLLGLVF